MFALDNQPSVIQHWTPDVVDHFRLNLDALPCAVFSLPGTDETQRRVVLRLSRCIPRADGGYHKEDVSKAFRAITQAARTCRDEPSKQRLACLKRALDAALKRNFPDRTSQRSAIQDLRSNLTVGSSVVGMLLQVARSMGLVP